MEVTINLPEDVGKVFISNGKNIERQVLEATAIKGYRDEQLSHAQVGGMLGLSRFKTDEFHKMNDIALNYSGENLEQDRRTLNKLFSK